MFDFWFDLPTAWRAIMGLVMIAISALAYFITGGVYMATGFGALGLVFLLFSGAGNSGSGYKF